MLVYFFHVDTFKINKANYYTYRSKHEGNSSTVFASMNSNFKTVDWYQASIAANDVEVFMYSG